MFDFFKNKSEAEKTKEKLVSEKNNKALVFILVMALLGVVSIFIYTFQIIVCAKANHTISSFYSASSVLLLMAGAAFAIGSLLGFLFGIPRSVSEATKDTEHSNKNYVGNDNLLQVSDWLTKIIVGVGLTQLYSIPRILKQYSEYLSDNSNIKNVPLVMFLVVYFAVFAFLFGYLWTRLYFIKLLNNSDQDINSEEFQNVKKEVNLFQDYLSAGVQNKGDMSEDPQKGKWGGTTVTNGKIITARVSESKISKDYFNINLEVKSTDDKKTLTGDVTFYLHPTFRNQNPTVAAVNGVATLNLLAWGAFTVGVSCDNGDTKLEIDLSEINDAPTLFKSR
jgi:ABC-type glycerol-3-phosphate transport system permease component